MIDSLFSCITSYNRKELNIQKSPQKPHSHRVFLPSQRPQSPTRHVPQSQVQLLSQLPLDPRSQSHRPSPVFLPSCIYTVMSCLAPPNACMQGSSKTLQKINTCFKVKSASKEPRSLETHCTASLKRPFVNFEQLLTLLHLNQVKRHRPCRKESRSTPMRTPTQTIQRG